MKTNLIARFFFMTAMLAVLLSVGAAAVSAQQSDDGRINVEHHFGGDVLYCVDKHFIATNDYATMLDAHGNPV